MKFATLSKACHASSILAEIAEGLHRDASPACSRIPAIRSELEALIVDELRTWGWLRDGRPCLPRPRRDRPLRSHRRRRHTIHTEMGNLRTRLSWAVKTGLIQRAPAIERPQTPPPRERYLTRDEAAALMDAAHAPHVRLAIVLMLTADGRIGEILELTWDRVDYERAQIKLATNDLGPKKGRATVPMNDTSRAALTVAKQAALSSDVIERAGRRVDSIKTGFRAAVKRAKIEHCTPHDLRRSAGRFMVENGTPIEEVAAYLGHTNPSITRSTYAKFSTTFLRGAAGSLEFNKPVSAHRTKEKRP